MKKGIYMQKSSKNNPKIPVETYSTNKNFMIYFRTLKKVFATERRMSTKQKTHKFTRVKQ